MDISVVTWNTQGDPRNDHDKNTYLDMILNRSDFVLLQECGAFATLTNYRYYSVHGVLAPGVLNNRCGTAIVYTRRPSDELLPYFYQGTRFGVAIKRRGVCIGTMHGTSGGVGLVDLRPFCNWLAGSRNTPRKFIVGADFNADPRRLTSAHGRIVGRAGSRNARYRVRAPYLPTHPRSGSRLDYFVSNLACYSAARRGVRAVSDHYAVFATFSEHMDPTIA